MAPCKTIFLHRVAQEVLPYARQCTLPLEPQGARVLLDSRMSTPLSAPTPIARVTLLSGQTGLGTSLVSDARFITAILWPLEEQARHE